MTLIKVDLPAPFSPNTTCTSPRRTSKSTPLSATTPGKRFVIARSSRMTLRLLPAVALTLGMTVSDSKGGAAPAKRARHAALRAASYLDLEAPVDGKDRLEARRCKRRGVDEALLQVVVLTGPRTAQKLHRRSDASEAAVQGLVLQQPNGLIDRHPRLDHRLVIAGAGDLAGPHRRVDLRNDVVGDHLDLVLKLARLQRRNSGGGCHSRAGDEVHVRERIECVLDQARLHVLPGVAVPRRQNLHLASLDGVTEPLIGRFHPACPGRPGEPAHVDGLLLAQLR